MHTMLLRRTILYIVLSIVSISAFSAPFSAYVLEFNEAAEHSAEMIPNQSNAPVPDTEHRGAACHHACGAHLLSHLQGYAAGAWTLPVSPLLSAGAPWVNDHAESIFLELPERPPRVLPIV